jgi:hypothetical protein
MLLDRLEKYYEGCEDEDGEIKKRRRGRRESIFSNDL